MVIHIMITIMHYKIAAIAESSIVESFSPLIPIAVACHWKSQCNFKCTTHEIHEVLKWYSYMWQLVPNKYGLRP